MGRGVKARFVGLSLATPWGSPLLSVPSVQGVGRADEKKAEALRLDDACYR